MLSDRDILKAINTGLVKIEPFEKALLRPACISLRLGDRIFEQIAGEIIDPYDDSTMKNFKEVKIDERNPYFLNPEPSVVTLELKNSGLCPVMLHCKMKIAKLALFNLETEASFGYDDRGGSEAAT